MSSGSNRITETVSDSVTNVDKRVKVQRHVTFKDVSDYGTEPVLRKANQGTKNLQKNRRPAQVSLFRRRYAKRSYVHFLSF